MMTTGDRVYAWIVYRLRGLGASTPDLISAAASRYGVPPSLALAVAQRESGLNQSAVGTSGERGVFQLMPGTARDLGVDPTDLAANVDGGVRYLSQMFAKFGDWRTALMAYNGGPGNVQRGTVSSAAQGYADAILGASVSNSAEEPLLGGSTIDSWDLGGTEVAGLSPVVWVGLGIAGIAALWAVSR